MTLLTAAALACSTGAAAMRAKHSPRFLWSLLGLALLSGVVGTSVTRQPVSAFGWAVAGTALAAAGLIWVAELAQAMAVRPPLMIDETRRDALLALWVFSAASAIAALALESIPHVPDEIAYLFQAKYFARGLLSVPAPIDPRAFELLHTFVFNGQWFSIFPPGWPAMLALGVRAGIATWVNPLIAAATIALLHRLLLRMYDRPLANLACALVALSPAYLLMSAGLMSHPLSVFCTVVTAFALQRTDGERPLAWSIVGGLALAMLSLTRLFESGMVVLAFAVYLGAQRPWRSRRGATTIMVLYGTSLIGPILTGLYQHALTGSALVDPITLYFDHHYYPGSNRLGFGPDIANLGWATDMLPGHSPLEAALHLQLNAQLTNTELFGWPFGSLLALALYLFWRRQNWQSADLLFVCLTVFPIAGQFFYWYSGADYGARYWYQTLIPCAVLSARGLRSAQVQSYSHALGRTAVLASACALVVFLPWRAVTKYHNFRGVGASVDRLVARCGMRNGLVLVRGASAEVDSQRYASAAFLNEPLLDGPSPIFARELTDGSSAALRRHWAERPLWVVQVPAEPKDAATVIVAPAAAACQAE